MSFAFTKDEILKLLANVKSGKISVKKALSNIQTSPIKDLGYANIDYHRGVRQGASEAIFGQGKTKEQITGIVADMLSHKLENIIITKIEPSVAAYLKKKKLKLTYFPQAKIGVANFKKSKNPKGLIVIVSGGTSDMPVCEEAAITAEILGNKVERVYDVGVAGIHRILSKTEILLKAKVVIAVAGMEGALASVAAGLVSCPVIAVPTSVGYGANYGGLAALLSMLNSCANGVSVVNIDNGFGAGVIASRING